MPPNKPYLDSSFKLILASDGADVVGPTAAVSPASGVKRGRSGP
jgi:hypothetical protein